MLPLPCTHKAEFHALISGQEICTECPPVSTFMPPFIFFSVYNRHEIDAPLIDPRPEDITQIARWAGALGDFKLQVSIPVLCG
jgi:hypothetical protein